MGWIAVAGAVLQGVLIWLKERAEHRADRREKLRTLRNDLKHARKERDYAKATTIWDTARRL